MSSDSSLFSRSTIERTNSRPDQQESSDGSEGDSNEAEFETNELPATEIIAEGASSPLQPPKQRYIKDGQEPETVQIKGSAESGTLRRGPKTGGAETQQLRKRQKGEDKVLLYIRHN
jgi:hypothetical protein